MAAFIVLCIDADIWWISLIILGAGIIVCSCFMASAHLVYGFGELVGNSKRIASGSSKEKVDIKELEKKITDLPKM